MKISTIGAAGRRTGRFPGFAGGCAALSLWIGCAVPAPAAEDVFELLDDVPPQLLSETDENGSLWTINRNGHLENSGTKLINQGHLLTVNGTEFTSEKVRQAKEVHRWLLTKRIGELEVTRDVYYDRKRGGVRYVDRFKNTGDQEAQANVEYNNSLRYPWQQLYTAQGREFDEKLGSRDTGIFIKMPEDREHQGILYLLAGDRSNHKPGIELDNNNRMRVRFTLSVPPGEARSVAGWIAQRRITEPGKIKELAAEFYRQHLLSDARISREDRAGIVNFDLMNGGAVEVEPHNEELLLALNELGDRVGVIRTGNDILWVAKESQLSGEIEGGAVKFDSRFGAVEADFAEIAAIQGGGGRARKHKVYFRDGTVLQTELALEGFQLKGADGWLLDLDIAQFEYLFSRIAESDGRIEEGINLFVRLHSGDVCGIAAEETESLQFMAPWGEFAVPLTHIESMSYLKNPSPRYRLELKDGSLITAFLVDAPLRLRAPRFDEVEVNAGEISGMWSALGDAPKLIQEIVEIEDISEVTRPSCLLKGENLIAGRLVNEEIHVVSGTTMTTLKPSEIIAIRRTYEEESDLLPVFEIELKGGDIILGTLREDTLRIEGEYLGWNVPVPHFVALQIPVAEK